MPIRLVDTNIVSYEMRKDPILDLYQNHLKGHTQAISFQTAAELEEGGRLAGWSLDRWNELDQKLTSLLIYDSDEDVVHRYADVRVARRNQPIGVADAWIAATALAYDIELISHNPKDFVGIPGLKLITEKL